jgi:bifunctional non-homologous end joining protein LigD
MASNKLSLYRQKRDFTRTDEPSGQAKVAPADYPRFVIQKHAATRLHYDLRLEVDGVFKSWAVTKGPSLDPKERRLAVETEDHPLDYGDFEGTIPRGEYGGGNVMLWDRGFWAADGDAAKALRKGELRFTLVGEKLQGSWVLVRLRHDREHGKRTNWLLIKRHDGHEHEGDGDNLLAQDRSVASNRSMEEIAAGKGRDRSPSCSAKRMASGQTRSGNRTASTALQIVLLRPRCGRAQPPTRLPLRHRSPGPRKGVRPCLPLSPHSFASGSDVRHRARIGCMRSSSTATGCSSVSRAARL